MKKLVAILTLTSSLFASDQLLDRMKKNSDQDLITQLAQLPRSSEVREAAGRYLESLEAMPARSMAVAATASAEPARAATSAEDFILEDGRNLKTTWDYLLNGNDDSQKARSAMVDIIKLAEYINTPVSDLTKAKEALITARRKTQADSCYVGKIIVGHAERFILALKKIGVEATLNDKPIEKNDKPFEEDDKKQTGYVEITIKLENMPKFSIHGETR